MKGFVRKEFEAAYTATTKDYTVVNSVEIGGAEKYLVVCFPRKFNFIEINCNNLASRIWPSFRCRSITK